MVEEIRYYKELQRLNTEYEDANNEISKIMKCKVIDQFRIHHLKKKCTKAKEDMMQLQTILYKNITA